MDFWSRVGGNPATLAGLPVIEFEEYASSCSEEEKASHTIYIATPEDVMGTIEQTLLEHGFSQYVRVTSSIWSKWMEEYFRGVVCEDANGKVRFEPISAKVMGERKASVFAVMTKFHKDRPIQKCCDSYAYWTPLQVGAALCEERISELTDATGENISGKNGNYSELTGLYWLWKNQKLPKIKNAEYLGLVHYRRILELSETDLYRLGSGEIDVVLPYPMPYENGIKEHPGRYLSKDDYRALLSAIEETAPEYAAFFNKVLKQRYMCNYNIMIARKEVFNDYCAWLFPILSRVEEIGNPRGWERSDRYIGYMGEILETLYFTYNRKRLSIVYTGCRFLI